MGLINVLVFLAVFAIAILALFAFAKPGTSGKTQAALDSALKVRAEGREAEILDLRIEHRFSSIPWLNAILRRTNSVFDLSRLLSQAGFTWTPGKFVLFSILVGITGGLIIDYFLHDIRVSSFLGLLTATAPWFYLWTKRSSRFAAMQQKLPETLDLIVSALRAGNSLTGALSVAAAESPLALRREFRLCFEEQNFGLDLRTALEHMVERVPLPDLRMMTTAMLIHKESGGNLAEVLEKTAIVVRERARLHQQIRVHTAQGRLTGLVLVLLPVALAVVLRFLNPAYLRVLVDRPIGHGLIAGAVVSDLIGFILIRRIINIRV